MVSAIDCTCMELTGSCSVAFVRRGKLSSEGEVIAAYGAAMVAAPPARPITGECFVFDQRDTAIRPAYPLQRAAAQNLVRPKIVKSQGVPDRPS
jgi:hypothetical protein